MSKFLSIKKCTILFFEDSSLRDYIATQTDMRSTDLMLWKNRGFLLRLTYRGLGELYGANTPKEIAQVFTLVVDGSARADRLLAVKRELTSMRSRRWEFIPYDFSVLTLNRAGTALEIPLVGIQSKSVKTLKCFSNIVKPII